MPRYFLQSLANGMNALEFIAERGRPVTLTEVAQALNTNKTTATRICHTLIELGFLQRIQEKKITLSPKVLSFGYAYITNLSWLKVAEYYAKKLFDKVGETVNISILEDTEILYLLRLRKSRYLPFDIRVGTKLPVYCTSMGKVLVAMGDPKIITPILDKLQFKPYTTNTIKNLDTFINELNCVKEMGYAICNQELVVGNMTIAAPILNTLNHAVAAVGMAMPISPYDFEQKEKHLAPQLIDTARQISTALLQKHSSMVMGDAAEMSLNSKKEVL